MSSIPIQSYASPVVQFSGVPQRSPHVKFAAAALAIDKLDIKGPMPRDTLTKLGCSLGTFSKEITDVYGPKEILVPALDALVKVIRANPTDGVFLLGQQKVKVHKIGSGIYGGSVYRLTTMDNKHPVALKVFFEPLFDPGPYVPAEDYHGPYAEAAAGHFFNLRQVCNVPEMYAAHPQEGWMLSEFIDKDNIPEFRRTGPRAEDLPDIRLDDARPVNYVGPYLVDLGKVIPLVSARGAVELIRRKHHYYDARPSVVFDRLRPEEYLKAFKLFIAMKDPKVLDVLPRKLWSLPEDKRWSAFQMLYSTRDPKTLRTLARQLECLPEDKQPDAVKLLAAIEDPEIFQALSQQRNQERKDA